MVVPYSLLQPSKFISIEQQLTTTDSSRSCSIASRSAGRYRLI